MLVFSPFPFFLFLFLCLCKLRERPGCKKLPQAFPTELDRWSHQFLKDLSLLALQLLSYLEYIDLHHCDPMDTRSASLGTPLLLAMITDVSRPAFVGLAFRHLRFGFFTLSCQWEGETSHLQFFSGFIPTKRGGGGAGGGLSILASRENIATPIRAHSFPQLQWFKPKLISHPSQHPARRLPATLFFRPFSLSGLLGQK